MRAGDGRAPSDELRMSLEKRARASDVDDEAGRFRPRDAKQGRAIAKIGRRLSLGDRRAAGHAGAGSAIIVDRKASAFSKLKKRGIGVRFPRRFLFCFCEAHRRRLQFTRFRFERFETFAEHVIGISATSDKRSCHLLAERAGSAQVEVCFKPRQRNHLATDNYVNIVQDALYKIGGNAARRCSLSRFSAEDESRAQSWVFRRKL